MHIGYGRVAEFCNTPIFFGFDFSDVVSSFCVAIGEKLKSLAIIEVLKKV